MSGEKVTVLDVSGPNPRAVFDSCANPDLITDLSVNGNPDGGYSASDLDVLFDGILKFRHVQRAKFEALPVSDNLWIKFAENSTALRTLELCDGNYDTIFNFTERGLGALLRIPTLECVNMTMHWIDFFPPGPSNIRDLTLLRWLPEDSDKLGPTSMCNVGTHHNLRKLYIERVSKFIDHAEPLISIAAGCRNLVDFYLEGWSQERGNAEEQTRGLSAVLALPFLEKVGIHRLAVKSFNLITSDTNAYKRIRTFCTSECENLGPRALHDLVSHMPQLEECNSNNRVWYKKWKDVRYGADGHYIVANDQVLTTTNDEKVIQLHMFQCHSINNLISKFQSLQDLCLVETHLDANIIELVKRNEGTLQRLTLVCNNYVEPCKSYDTLLRGSALEELHFLEEGITFFPPGPSNIHRLYIESWECGEQIQDFTTFCDVQRSISMSISTHHNLRHLSIKYCLYFESSSILSAIAENCQQLVHFEMCCDTTNSFCNYDECQLDNRDPNEMVPGLYSILALPHLQTFIVDDFPVNSFHSTSDTTEDLRVFPSLRTARFNNCYDLTDSEITGLLLNRAKQLETCHRDGRLLYPSS